MNSVQAASRAFSVVTRKGHHVSLLMQELGLSGHILPVGGRLVVKHVFRSAESEPVEAVYAFGLPRDSALRKFRIEGKDYTVSSDLRSVEEAVELYESGIQNGHLSALARLYGDGLVNLSLGNLQPQEEVAVLLEVLVGVESRDHGYRFRFPFTLAPCYHRDARVAEAEPGVGEMELPEDRFGDLLLPRFRKDSSNLHRIGFDLTLYQPDSQATVSSPSHTIRVHPENEESVRLSLARERDLPDRDLVLDVRHSSRKATVFAGLDPRGRGQLIAHIPSVAFGTAGQRATQVVLVLDRSGSMEGTPIQQAKRSVEACLGALSDHDRFGIVAFNSIAERFAQKLMPANQKHRKRARVFLENCQAGGGTELYQALRAAGALFQEPGGNLLLITDGQVYETEAILRAGREMGHRVHVLGIGSASQDRFLSLLARQTGGKSRFLTPSERVDLAALEMFASIGHPVAEEVSCVSRGIVKVEIAPLPATAIFADDPMILHGETVGPGIGELELAWGAGSPGSISISFEIPAVTDTLAETLRLLRGARLLTDWDSRIVPSSGAAGRRESKRVEERIRRLSEEFQLASRRMALVAVIERKGDRPGTLPRTQVVPVGMPEDVLFESYFGTAGNIDFCLGVPARARRAGTFLGEAQATLRRMVPGGSKKELNDLLQATEIPAFSRLQDWGLGPGDPDDSGPEGAGLLVEMAALIEPDGGMPGEDLEDRLLRSLLTLLCFHADERIRQSGTFKKHTKRLIMFISGLSRDRLSEKTQNLVDLGMPLLEEADFVWEDWTETAAKLTRKKALEGEEVEQILSQLVSV